MNPKPEPPPETADEALNVLSALPEPWTVSRTDATTLIPAIKAALQAGWTGDGLLQHLSQNPAGVQYPARVLARRLADLPQRPLVSRPVQWRGAANARTRDLARSPSPNPTEPSRHCFVHGAVTRHSNARPSYSMSQIIERW